MALKDLLKIDFQLVGKGNGKATKTDAEIVAEVYSLTAAAGLTLKAAAIQAALYQDDDAHDTCSLTACLNPLHPGPCKGWKGTLHSVSPGAWKALEAARVEKANASRIKKIEALKAQGKPIPYKLLQPIKPKPHPDAGKTANAATGEAHAAGQAVTDAAGVKTSTPGKVTLGQAIKPIPQNTGEKGPKGKKPTVASKGIAFVIAQEKVTPQYKLDKAAAITPEQWAGLSEADQSVIRGELAKIKVDGFGPQQKKADELLAKLTIGGPPKATDEHPALKKFIGQKDSHGVVSKAKAGGETTVATGAGLPSGYLVTKDSMGWSLKYKGKLLRTSSTKEALVEYANKHHEESTPKTATPKLGDTAEKPAVAAEVAQVLEKAKAEPPASVAKLIENIGKSKPKVKEMTEPGNPTPAGQATAAKTVADAIFGKQNTPIQTLADAFGAMAKTGKPIKEHPGFKMLVNKFAQAALKKATAEKMPGLGHGDNDAHIGTFNKEIADHIAEGKPGLPPLVAKMAAHGEASKPENVKQAVEKAAKEAAAAKIVEAHKASPPKVQPLAEAASPPGVTAMTPNKVAEIVKQNGSADIVVGGKKITVGFEGSDEPGKLTMAPGGGYTVTTPDGEKVTFGKGEHVQVAYEASKTPEAPKAELPKPVPEAKVPAAEKPKPLPKHVQNAIDMAKGVAPGASWSKNHLVAYQPLSADEFNALPPDVRDKIVAELEKSTTKFLDPKKIKAAKDLLAKFGHGGESSGAPQAPTPPKIENVSFTKDLHNHAVTEAQAKEVVDKAIPHALFLVAKETAGLVDSDQPGSSAHVDIADATAKELIEKHTKLYTDDVLDKPPVAVAIAKLNVAAMKQAYAESVLKAKTHAFSKIVQKTKTDNGSLSPIQKAALAKYGSFLIEHKTPDTSVPEMDKLKADVKKAETDLDTALHDALKQANAPKPAAMSNAQIVDRTKELLGDDALNPKTNLSLSELQAADKLGKTEAAFDANAFPAAVLADPAVAAKFASLSSVHTQINAGEMEVAKLEDHIKKMHGSGVDKNGNPLSAEDKQIVEKHAALLRSSYAHLFTTLKYNEQKLPLAKAAFEEAAKKAEKGSEPAALVELSDFDQQTVHDAYRKAWGSAAGKVVLYGIKTYGTKTEMKDHPEYTPLTHDLGVLQDLSGKLAVAHAKENTALLNLPTNPDTGKPDTKTTEWSDWQQKVADRLVLEKQFSMRLQSAQGKLDTIRLSVGLKKRALPKLDSPAVKTAAAETAYYQVGGYGKPLYGKSASAKQYLVAKVGSKLAVPHKTSSDKALEKSGKLAATTAKVAEAMPAPKTHVKPPSTEVGKGPNAASAASLGYHFTPKVAEGDQAGWPTSEKPAYVASPEVLEDLRKRLSSPDIKQGIAAQKEFKWSINNMESKGGSSSGKSALYAYTGSSYGSINAKLNGLPPGAKSPGGQITSIDNAFKAAPPLEGDVVLYRGFSSPEHVFKSGKWNDVNVAGTEWTQRSYSSTSGALGTAQSFAGYNGVVMRIIIPKEMGVKGINAKGGQHPGENEIILERGIRYRVVADYGKGPSGDSRRYIDVMVVPSPYDKPE